MKVQMWECFEKLKFITIFKDLRGSKTWRVYYKFFRHASQVPSTRVRGIEIRLRDPRIDIYSGNCSWEPSNDKQPKKHNIHRHILSLNA